MISLQLGPHIGRLRCSRSRAACPRIPQGDVAQCTSAAVVKHVGIGRRGVFLSTASGPTIIARAARWRRVCHAFRLSV